MKQSEIWKPVVIEGGKLPIENDRIRRELRNASRDHLKSSVTFIPRREYRTASAPRLWS